MILKAAAKVNLALDVVGTLENGYHELDMIMAPISWYDTISIEKATQDHITCPGYELPERNTITKTLDLLREKTGITSCFKVDIQKQIPMQAGLAGGSADAAAVFQAVLELEGLEIPFKTQIEWAKQIGADVPFCLFRRWARVKGIGEKIEPIDSDWSFPALLVKPKEGVSTPEAFSLWGTQKQKHPDVDLVQKAIEGKNMDLLVQTMSNSLQGPAFELVKDLTILKEKMIELGLVRVLMSGSGSTLIGFSVEEEVLQHAKEVLEKEVPFVQIVTIGKEEA